ncbi:MAG: glycosyltransferase [Saccharolobus sp.]
MEKLGVHSWIVCAKYNASYLKPCEIIETGKKNGSIIDGFMETWIVAKLIKDKKPSIVFQVNTRAFIFLTAIVWKLKHLFIKSSQKKYIPFFMLMVDWDGQIDQRHPIRSRLFKFLVMINSHFLDLIVLNSSCAYNSAFKIPFINRNKLIYINYGYPQDIYSLKKYEETSREKIILCVARITPLKGQELLIDAFVELLQVFKDWKLIIVGPVEDALYYNNLKNISKNYLNKNIFFQISVEEERLEKLYEKASIFCLPSYRESVGMVRIEAMSKGLPVLTSEAGCGKDFENFGAMLFKTGNKEDLKNKLKLLMENEELRKKLADESIKNINSYEDYAKKILMQYKIFEKRIKK